MATKNPEYQKRVVAFHEKAGHVRLMEVINASENGHLCQLCGNRHLTYLCRIRNEKGEEWLIGRDCHTVLDNLQAERWKIAMNEIVTCSQCGKSQRRGELPIGAYIKKLCRDCWIKEEA